MSMTVSPKTKKPIVPAVYCYIRDNRTGKSKAITIHMTPMAEIVATLKRFQDAGRSRVEQALSAPIVAA